MNPTQVHELLLQSLEHERGGIKIYQTAIASAQREDLAAEWTNYLRQTEDWELLGEVAKGLTGRQQEVLQSAYDRIEDEEDEHLYHNVTSAVEAQHAKETRQPRH